MAKKQMCVEDAIDYIFGLSTTAKNDFKGRIKILECQITIYEWLDLIDGFIEVVENSVDALEEVIGKVGKEVGPVIQGVVYSLRAKLNRSDVNGKNC